MSEEQQERGLEILHFSVEYPKVSQYSYFIHNIVWRALDSDFKSVCLGWCEEWRRTQVVFDTDRAEEYYSGLDFQVNKLESQFGGYPMEIVQREGIRRDTVFHEAWEQQFPFVTYIEKFDCFRAWGYTESNAITQACVHEIEMLKLGEHMYRGRFAPWCHFRRVVETLDRFWD